MITTTSTGYGPSNQWQNLIFNGDVLAGVNDEPDAERNKLAFADMI